MITRVFFTLFFTLFLCSCASESIEDRRHGQQLVCHDQEKTLTVSNADNLAHMNHGDSVGPCAEDDS
jgi:hypothetical protein